MAQNSIFGSDIESGRIQKKSGFFEIFLKYLESEKKISKSEKSDFSKKLS